MNRITNPSPRTAAFGAAVAAIASTVGAAFQLTHEQSSASTVVGTAEHIAITAFSVLLLATVPVTAYLARRVRVTKPAVFAIAGAFALASLAVISNVRGEDASFFAAVAIPSNLAILGGWIGIAVAGNRTGNVPRPVAIGLPLVLIVSIPLSALGGGLIAAAYFAGVAVWATKADQPARVPAGAPAVA